MIEQGFSLPASAIHKHIRQLSLGIPLGVGLVYLQDPEHFWPSLVWLLPAIAVLLLLVFWFLKRYKYVYVSPTGLRGRPTAGFRWRTMAWGALASTKDASLNGLKGRLLLARQGGVEIFIPQAILESAEFTALVRKYAPAAVTVLRPRELT